MATPTGTTTIAVEVEARVKITDTVTIPIVSHEYVDARANATIRREHVLAIIAEPERPASERHPSVSSKVVVLMHSGLTFNLWGITDLSAANELIFGGEVEA